MRRFVTLTAAGLLGLAAIAARPALAADIPFITGGIGKGEREAIFAKKDQYNFEVKVALTTGHYLGNVRVMIEDKSGDTVLDAQTDGPLFFARLPAGTYRVHGHYEDQKQSQNVTIRDNTPMREVIFRFKGNEEVVEDAAETLPR